VRVIRLGEAVFYTIIMLSLPKKWKSMACSQRRIYHSVGLNVSGVEAIVADSPDCIRTNKPLMCAKVNAFLVTIAPATAPSSFQLSLYMSIQCLIFPNLFMCSLTSSSFNSLMLLEFSEFCWTNCWMAVPHTFKSYSFCGLQGLFRRHRFHE